MTDSLDFSFLRQQVVGIDSTFVTPFGPRLMVYCDYTASGRCLIFVEKYLQSLQRRYANTHSEDDVTGRSMTRLLHQAERIIKDSVNAGPEGRIITCGSGATGAIDKFQQLIGVALPPVTRETLLDALQKFTGEEREREFERFLRDHQPVVFVGPYEHHSNEISWRHGLATVIEVHLSADGCLDCEHLESLLRDPAYQGRLRIGSFAAASNVTGMCTPVERAARLLHEHDALACFDYAASAPYTRIDMNPDPGAEGGDPSIDAVFMSPHKFLGGPGSSGVLVFNSRLYRRDLPPTVAGGGTVDFVGPQGQDYIEDIEEREKAGTPGVLQTMKAALAMQIKQALTVERIETAEREFTKLAMSRWSAHPRVEILGNPDPDRRVSIISFNVQDPRGGYLHPKFLTALLNDLFGIQSRAGCSCAGPYGHLLLGIPQSRSEQYRRSVRKGYCGIKPGWCRVGFHYVMDDVDVNYVVDAVEFVATYGYLFLCLYRFDIASGTWTHEDGDPDESIDEFSLASALHATEIGVTALSAADRSRLYAGYLEEARERAERLEPRVAPEVTRFEGELRDLQFFTM